MRMTEKKNETTISMSPVELADKLERCWHPGTPRKTGHDEGGFCRCFACTAGQHREAIIAALRTPVSPLPPQEIREADLRLFKIAIQDAWRAGNEYRGSRPNSTCFAYVENAAAVRLSQGSPK